MEVSINNIMDNINNILKNTNTEDQVYKLMRVVGQYNNKDVIAALVRICVVLNTRLNLKQSETDHG